MLPRFIRMLFVIREFLSSPKISSENHFENFSKKSVRVKKKPIGKIVKILIHPSLGIFVNITTI